MTIRGQPRQIAKGHEAEADSIRSDLDARDGALVRAAIRMAHARDEAIKAGNDLADLVYQRERLMDQLDRITLPPIAGGRFNA